jgi:hypothetical protein
LLGKAIQEKTGYSFYICLILLPVVIMF